MRILRFKDETQCEVSMCGAHNNVLWVSSPEIDTIAKAVEVFSDTNKTEHMTCSIVEWPDDEPQVFDGYTNLILVQNQEDAITVALRKE